MVLIGGFRFCTRGTLVVQNSCGSWVSVSETFTNTKSERDG